jgi:hypothetical protein
MRQQRALLATLRAIVSVIDAWHLRYQRGKSANRRNPDWPAGNDTFHGNEQVDEILERYNIRNFSDRDLETMLDYYRQFGAYRGGEGVRTGTSDGH